MAGDTEIERYKLDNKKLKEQIRELKENKKQQVAQNKKEVQKNTALMEANHELTTQLARLNVQRVEVPRLVGKHVEKQLTILQTQMKQGTRDIADHRRIAQGERNMEDVVKQELQ